MADASDTIRIADKTTVTQQMAVDSDGKIGVSSMAPGTGATALGKAVDSPAGATDTGIAALAVRDDALATLTPGDGDYTHLRTNAKGATWVQDQDPANVDDAADITLTSGAETTLGAAPAGATARLLSSKAANTVNIRIGKTGQVGASRGLELVPGAAVVWPGTATLYGYAGSTGQIVTQSFVVV